MTRVRQVVKRRRSRRTAARTGWRGVARWLAITGLILAAIIYTAALVGTGTLVSAFAFYSESLPEPGAISFAPSSGVPSRLYDRTGQQLLYEISDPRRSSEAWVSLSNMPVDMLNATIAVEDPTFFKDGVDDTSVIARVVSNTLSDIHDAGSRPSITQRLVKNLLAEQSESGFEAKLKELVLTIRLGQKYGKDEILEWYLNTHPYGDAAYGVEGASQVYFGKPVDDLSLGEVAMLVGISSAPGLNPADDYSAARERQAYVLKAMTNQGYVSVEQADAALSAPLEVKAPEQQFDLVAPHFAIAARKQLERMFGPELLRRGGLVIYTTLDYPLYLQSQCAARTQVARLSGQRADVVVPPDDGSPCLAAKYLQPLPNSVSTSDHHASNAAVVVIEAQTGEVLALLGSLDYYNSAIGGGTNIAGTGRQPGATIQPFAYLTAFQQGYTPATMMLDVRTSFDLGGDQPFVPYNLDKQFHGPMSIRTALANAMSVPAVQIINWAGTDNVLHTAHAMGINTLRGDLAPLNPEVAVSGGDVTLEDMTYAYSVLANSGVMRGTRILDTSGRSSYRILDPTFILRVEDQAGNILWEYGKGDTFGSSTVVEPGLSYLVTDILADDKARLPSVGASGPFPIDRPAAVMFGASGDSRDTWAIGYTPQVAIGVWVGNTDDSPMIDLPASVAAAPVWQAIMRYAHQSLPAEKWERPPDIVEIAVCDPSGLLPTRYCPTRPEIFKSGTEPTIPDNMFQLFAINIETGRLATVYTPPNLIEQRVFQVVPPEAAEWAQGAGIAQPPSAYDNINIPPTTGDLTIVEPAAFSYVRGVVAVKGNARDPAFQTYRLDFGAGLNPDQWFQIGSDSANAISNGLLGVWDTTGLDGLYSLRLTLVRADSSFQQAIIQLTVDNISPSIRLALPHDGQSFNLSDEFVVIQPIAEDNVAMDRVEFYVDGKLVVTSNVEPFAGRWGITTAGKHIIQARAFDSAGNMTTSQNVSILVIP
jgi:membrane peptidoglycan carboxypeptidase